MIAGCAASLAVLLEASTALILVCVLGYCVTLNNGRNYLAYFLFGCIPCGALQLLYNTACFGGPFNVSYDYANPVVMWYIEGRLFSIPTLSDFLGVLVLPYRGLFFHPLF